MSGKYWWDEYEKKEMEQQVQRNQQGQQGGTPKYWFDDGSIAINIRNSVANRVNSWLNNHNNYVSDYQKRYSGRKYSYEDAYVGDSADWMNTMTERKKKSDEEANALLSYLDQNKDYLDAKWVKQVRDTITGARESQGKIVDIATQDNQWWNSFGTEELLRQYGSAEKAYTATGKAIAKRNDQLALNTEAYAAELEELKKFVDEAYDIGGWYEYYQAGKTDYLDYDKSEDPHRLEVYNRLQNEYGGDVSLASDDYIQRSRYLEEAKRVQEQAREDEEYAKQLAPYLALMQNADFAENSAFKSKYLRPAEKYTPAGSNYTYVTDTGYEDIWYDYINRQKAAIDLQGLSDMAGYAEFAGYDKGYLKEMTDDEIKIYNYLYKTQSKEAAEEFISLITSELAYLRRKRQQEEAALYATEHPFHASAWSVLSSPAKAISAFGQIGNYIDVGEIDKNAGYNKYSYIPSTIRGTVSSKIATPENGKWGEVGSWTYQLGMSMGDFLMNTAASGGNSTFSSLLMGSGAMADTVVAAKDRGLSDDQAFILGAVAGVAEIITEKISLDALLNGDLSKGAVRYILTNAVTEGSEEINSSLINLAADILVSKDQSEWQMAIKEYREKNPNATAGEAFQKVFGDTAMSIGLDGLGGALMGGFMGSAGASINYVTEAAPALGKNKEAVEKYGKSVPEMIKAGLSGDPKSRGYDLANFYQSKINSGKELSGYEIWQLKEAVETDAAIELHGKIEEAHAQFVAETKKEAIKVAKARLTELGETGDVDAIADAVAKKTMGERLTSKERKLLVNSFGSQVAKEIAPAENESTYKSLDSRAGDQGRFGVSESGKATVRSTGQEVNLATAEVTKVGNGEITFKLEDGSEVYAGDIDFASDDQSYLVSAVSGIENITPAAATAMLHDIVDTSKPLGKQLNGIDEAFTYGYNGYSEADLKAGSFTGGITKKQMMSAYKLGQSARNANTEAADAPKVRMRTALQAKLTDTERAARQRSKFDSGDVGVYFMDGKNITKVGESGGYKGTGQNVERRMAAVNYAKLLSKLGIGNNYYFFESYKNANGDRVYKDADGNEVPAPNGFYREGTGDIYIDLNAGNEGQGVALFTLGHELTHFIKEWSEKKFKVLADFLVAEYGNTDLTMRERVLAKQAELEGIRKHQDDYKPVKYEEAFEEVVADAMSAMLADGNLHEKLAELRTKDKGLVDKIIEFFNRMIAKFQALYKDLDPEQRDARDVRAMKDSFDRIQQAFAEALVEASDNFRASMESVLESGSNAKKTAKAVDTFTNETVAAQPKDVGVKNSDRVSNKKLAGEQYSSQETDLDTEGDSAYDNAKKEAKQEVKIYGQDGKAEDHASFIRRMHEGSRRVKQIGKTVFAYEPARAIDTSGAVSDAARELRRLGIKYFYHNGLEYNHNGVTYVDNGAICTIEQQVVGIYAKAFGDGMEFAGHEAFHVWKKSAGWEAYVETLRRNISITSSVYGLEQADTVLREYFGGDVEALSRDESKAQFLEELYALVSGKIHSGTNESGLQTMFKDYAAVKAAWNDLINKQATQKGQKFSDRGAAKKDIRYSDRDNAPTFYSQMAKVVDAVKQEKLGAASVVSMLRGKGVKAEEIKWSGIETWLEGKKSVTKAELQEFIAGSMLQVEEYVRDSSKANNVKVKKLSRDSIGLYIDGNLKETFTKDADDRWWPSNPTDYGDFYVDSDHILDEYSDTYGNKTMWSEYKLKGGKNYREITFKMPKSTYSNDAMRVHWGDKAEGVLVHARIQDFKVDGKKMLFVEEIQSDYHNEGHSEGYFNDQTEEMYFKGQKELVEQISADTRMARYVKKHGVDEILRFFKSRSKKTTGEQVAQAFHDASGFLFKKSGEAEAVAEFYNKFRESQNSRGKVPDAPFKENYHEFVLKRLLREAAEKGYDSIGWTTAETQDDRWKNDNPHKEGTGKSGFLRAYIIEYDQDIPKFLKKYGKQWGAEVGQTTLANGEVVWSMDITPAMKKSVLTEGQPLYSERGDGVSNRSLLANAFEGLSRNSDEYAMIQEYRNRIRLLEEQEEKLDKINAEIREIRFTNGKYDSKKLAELEAKKKEISKAITRHDKKLLEMEVSAPLRKVIEQERKKEAQKTKAHIAEIQQNKQLRAEQTELRHKVRKVIRDLDKILRRGNKQRNVKEDMKGFVSKALELADYLFTDHISNDDLIMRGIDADLLRGDEAELVRETQEIIQQIQDNYGTITEEEYKRLTARKKRNMEALRELLTKQRNRRLNTPVYNLFDDLVTEYAKLKNSDQDAVKAAYNPEVERFLRSYMGDTMDGADSDKKTLLQNMRVADMTTQELEHLYYAYTMVLHSVRDANKLFVQGKAESVQKMADQIFADFSQRKIPEKKMAIVARNIANKIGWDYEKLYYALDRIGSEAFTELVMNVANSENIVMQDVIEAAIFRDEMVEKYGFNNWDVSKKINREFLDNTGKKFKLTLGQLMALYAYSRRKGALDHIEYGGFVFGDEELTNPNPADSYKLTREQCEALTDILTKEQKGYVEAMQKFLSETMGGKGNEVSMMLYGIKMFTEKNYFPIKVAGQFKPQAQEAQAKAAAGFSSMTNAGFTHKQNPNAKAPFVLEGFNEVWADHVNEMSRYHGTVPALEDMRRVMNRSSYSEAGTESMSIKQLMENAFGKEAVQYFDNLYREANSGAITDKLQAKYKKLLSLFRKNSVAYSLSVLIQQPAAMVRAYALIDRRYFGFKGVGALTGGVAKAVTSKWNNAYDNAYNEMLKYAPGVTMAKEIGGFDTHTGSSIRGYLLDTNKSFIQKMKTENALGKAGAVLDLVDNNAIANLPNVADKIAWIEIWNACKRETIAKHKDLVPTSDEFLQIVGDRFTEAIRATQVYDSMFSKSPMLKSKNLAVQYLVSFMNEPNTVANMVEKAVRDVSRGDWKSGARTAVVVIHSIIFTNLLKSIIYAMRDDDEDETYTEKYLESLASGIMSDFNPLSYIPIAKDVWSKAQGFDVERPDVAIIADAIEAVQAIYKNYSKDTENMTEEQLAEFDKKVIDANWKLAESVAAFFGIPVKNIRREINGFMDHAQIAHENAGNTTWSSAWDKVRDSVIDSIPFMSSKPKSDKLYEAMIAGDKAYVERIKGSYNTESAYQSAVRKALRENDSRIHDAAQARYEGRTEDYKRIFREIQAEGNFSFDDIMSAINSEESKIRNGVEPEKATSSYSAKDYVEALVLGDKNSATAIKNDIIDTMVVNGKSRSDAEKDFSSNIVTGINDAYSSGLLDEAGAKRMLMDYAGKDKEEADSKVDYWVFCEDNPKYKDIYTESHVAKYYEFAKPSGISIAVYAKYIEGTKGLSAKHDEWGDVKLSKRDQVLDVIDSLPLTWQQKDALYLASGYSESKIWDVPW